MIPKLLYEVTEVDIQRLKDDAVDEKRTIEYKKALPGTRDEDKREFLSDISSFANTDGGDIIYGVAEDQGFITAIVGVSCNDLDAEKLRLENLIRDGVSPRIVTNIQLVPCNSGKLLIIRAEKSWVRPHRVTFRGHDKFYARTSAGKYPLDVGQLRAAFVESATLTEQMNAFRLDRLIELSNDRAPVLLAKRPILALHVVPFGSLSNQQEFDVTSFVRNQLLHRPWNTAGWGSRMTFDGALVSVNRDGQGRVSAYTQFYSFGAWQE